MLNRKKKHCNFRSLLSRHQSRQNIKINTCKVPWGKCSSGVSGSFVRNKNKYFNIPNVFTPLLHFRLYSHVHTDTTAKLILHVH